MNIKNYKFRIIEFLYLLLGVSLFTSKSGITIFGLFLFIISIVDSKTLHFLKKEKLIILLLFVYPLGAFLNIFSVGGVESSIQFLKNFSWVLFVLPTVFALQYPKCRKSFFVGSFLGLVIAIGFSIYRFGSEFNFVFNNEHRIASFWDLSRWGTFTSSAILVLFGFFLTDHFTVMNKWRKIISILVLFLTCFSLILSQSRAPWVATVFGLVVILLLNHKAKLYALIFIPILAVVLLMNPQFKDRIMSIGSVKIEEGKMTSRDLSNAGRLHMWKVAFDMFKEEPLWGIGFHNTESTLKKFLDHQGLEYQNKYIMSQFSFKDQHSSYLASLVQMGIFFFTFFWSLLFIVLIKGFRGFLKHKRIFTIICLALLIRYLVEFVFYSSYESYEMVLLVPVLVLLSINPDSVSRGSL
ncbi:MAG TPA: O-antigen ligase family protein [Pseudobdellovibrionaceae bacterium]|nr:O-antigen ligase family protein [Pseudobdellovibrionaceae bacterium]